jgi:hypothetical protein
MIEALGVLAGLGAAALVAGCGGGRQGGGAAAKAAPTAASHVVGSQNRRPDSDHNGIPDPITMRGGLGDTLVLEGSGLEDDPANPSSHAKDKVRVTLLRVRGPFKGFDVPAGREIVGLDLRFVNVGRFIYKNPQPQGDLTVAGGETGKQTSLIAVGAKSPCDDRSLALRSGRSKRTCIAFEVPAGRRPRSFEYVADAGYGDRGLWRLR